MNNHGVRLMFDGRNHDALRVFTKALKITKAFLLRVEKNSRCRDTSKPPSSPAFKREIMTPLPRGSANTREHTIPYHRKTQSAATVSMVTSVLRGDLSIFCDPLIVEEEACEYSSGGRACLMKLVITMVFNMALANHRSGCSSADLTKNIRPSVAMDSFSDHASGGREDRRASSNRNRALHLKKALAFYELSCQIQDRENIQMERECVLLHINNIGHIHACLGNAPMAERYFLSLLESLLEDGGSPHRGNDANRGITSISSPAPMPSGAHTHVFNNAAGVHFRC